ncbi:MAG: ORF6N domain-containing protein [Planctomycetota bacterium]
MAKKTITKTLTTKTKRTSTKRRSDGAIVPMERIEQSILLIRGEKVMLDADLARLYGVTTKRLNEQVKRNRSRFPGDFMFQLTGEEKADVVANCDHLKNLKFSPVRPHAFTEHGAVMLASVLNSPIAVNASIQVVRAFVRLRRMLASNATLARKLADLEKKYDAQFRVVFDAIRQLMAPPEPKRKPIGFTAEMEDG